MMNQANTPRPVWPQCFLWSHEKRQNFVLQLLYAIGKMVHWLLKEYDGLYYDILRVQRWLYWNVELLLFPKSAILFIHRADDVTMRFVKKPNRSHINKAKKIFWKQIVDEYPFLISGANIQILTNLNIVWKSV